MSRRALVVVVLVGCGGQQTASPPVQEPAPHEVTSSPSALAPAPPEDPACRALAASAPDVPPPPAGAPDAGPDEYRPVTRIAAPKDSKDFCATADSNIQRAENTILSWPAPPPSGKTWPKWDHKRSPAYLNVIAKKLGLGPEESALLRKNGFVVPARLDYGTYAYAYHSIYESEVPLYVSIDSILHAIYVGHDSLLAGIEDRRLIAVLGNLLARLHCALPSAGYPADIARDLDVYLTVARRLLENADLPGSLGDRAVETQVAGLVAQAKKADAMVTVSLFGRDRVIDFTQFTPRGHYAGSETLEPYFRAVMWLSRLELNLVSRSSRSSQPGEVPNPAETPREDILALALADLAQRAGAMPDLELFDRAFTLLAGRREDVTIAQVAALAKKAGITGYDDAAAARLRGAIGNDFQRTARIHYMPEGSTVLPAILTMIGPRIVPDTPATRPLVHSETPDRHALGGADMAYILGNDRALAYLAADRKQFPMLDRQLAAARKILADAPRTDDLYTAWLDAIRALAVRSEGPAPSFASTDAGADLRLGSTVAAFAQLRHNYVLLVGQAYDEGGCVIPDAYVEPALATYEALVHYAERGASVMKELDPTDASGAQAYFAGLGRVLATLRAIVRIELAGQPLPKDALRFLAQVVEMTPGSTGGPPTYTGWYFDLFSDRQGDGLKPADLIADFYTSSSAGISYLGVTVPRIGVFVVDVNGEPRAMVGPVARAYETHGPIATRLTDETAKALPESQRLDPWARSYTVPPPPPPSFALTYNDGILRDTPTDDRNDYISIEAKESLGPVTVELLNHNHEALTSKTQKVGKGTTVFKFPRKKKGVRELEGIHVQIGAWQDWAEVHDQCGGCASMAAGSYANPADASP